MTPNKKLTLKRNYLFIGNPGVGKSTLLNCLMLVEDPNLSDELKFKSGVSLGQGLTYKFDKRTVGNITFMDTPGLEDVEMKKKAAEEITKALQHGGSYQVVFVVTLEGGRVRPQDPALISLVLKSAKEITSYGIIINKLTSGLMKKFENEEEVAKFLALFSLEEHDCFHIPLFLKKRLELEDVDDVTADIPELSEFMKTVPLVGIGKENVVPLKPNEFPELVEKLEAQINRLLKDKEKMEEKMEAERAKYMERIEEMIEENKKRYEEQIREMKSQHRAHIEELKRKEEKHRQEMQRLKNEDANKHKELLEQMKKEQLAQQARMQAAHEEALEQERQMRNEMEERYLAQKAAVPPPKKKWCSLM